MISKALSFITDFLNHEIKMSFGINDNIVVGGSLINPDGSVSNNIENKVIVSVINLEHETTVKSMNTYRSDGDKYGKVPRPVFLNLYLLIAANYEASKYSEALKMLSKVIGVFQVNTYFTRQKHPKMERPLDKLTFEIYNIPINELSHIWSGIGAKYVPSIIYKVRMITIQEDIILKEVPAITGLQGKTNTKK